MLFVLSGSVRARREKQSTGFFPAVLAFDTRGAASGPQRKSGEQAAVG